MVNPVLDHFGAARAILQNACLAVENLVSANRFVAARLALAYCLDANLGAVFLPNAAPASVLPTNEDLRIGALRIEHWPWNHVSDENRLNPLVFAVPVHENWECERVWNRLAVPDRSMARQRHRWGLLR